MELGIGSYYGQATAWLASKATEAKVHDIVGPTLGTTSGVLQRPQRRRKYCWPSTHLSNTITKPIGILTHNRSLLEQTLSSQPLAIRLVPLLPSVLL